MEVDEGEQSLDQSLRPGSDSTVEKTPPRTVKSGSKIQLPGDDATKNTRLEPVKVPKTLNFPERYMSPTDRLISPVSKGVLARNRKVGAMLPPDKTPPKIGGSRLQRIDLFQA